MAWGWWIFAAETNERFYLSSDIGDLYDLVTAQLDGDPSLLRRFSDALDRDSWSRLWSKVAARAFSDGRSDCLIAAFNFVLEDRTHSAKNPGRMRRW
jgi:hypothetical protein